MRGFPSKVKEQRSLAFRTKSRQEQIDMINRRMCLKARRKYRKAGTERVRLDGVSFRIMQPNLMGDETRLCALATAKLWDVNYRYYFEFFKFWGPINLK